MTKFFDTYKDIGGGEYVGTDEKEEMIESGIPFQVIDVAYDAEGKYGERYVLRILKPDEETGEVPQDEDGNPVERLMSFSAGSVDSRDRMLLALTDWLTDADNEPPFVKVERIGRSVIIAEADAPEAKPKPKPAARKPAARKPAGK